MRLTRFLILSLLITLVFVSVVPEFVTASQNGEMTGNDVRVRASANTSSEILGHLEKGNKVTVLGEKGSWLSIRFEGEIAYVHSDFVLITSSEEKEDNNINKEKSNAVPSDATVFVNDEELEADISPYSEKTQEGDNLLVPYRAIAESLNVNFTWHQLSREVRVSDQGKEVIFQLNDRKTFVDGKETELNAQPILISGRTLIPLRFFAEIFGADVGWSNKTREARITRVEKVIEDDVLSEELENAEITGQVSGADNLNVREGPGTNFKKIDNITKGTVVAVKKFSNEWAIIGYSGKEGYVHTNYLKLDNGGNNDLRILAATDWEKSPDRSILSWNKIGGATVDVVERTTGLTLKTNATSLQNPKGSQEGIASFDVEKTSNGSEIDITLEDGYHYVFRESFGSIILTILPPGIEGKRIVIDAGHGDQDSGGLGNGLLEKEIVLDVSLRAQKLLEDAGVDVIMTRNRDEFLELYERSEIANDEFADAFISVHANAAYASATGSETFWHNGYSGPNSKKLAKSIQNAMLAKLGTYDRGVKENSFSVIRRSTMPSVLMELAFMTNKEDAAKLKTDSFRERSAEAILEGLKDFYQE